MKAVVFALLLIATFAMAATEKAECHPACRWQCDDPVCPAVCHPICERPRCQMQCEETTCAKCTVHCEKPVCSVRCPKDMCEKESCPKCETVCAPAQCHTKCVAPEPKCSPVCEETRCDWKCRKPSLCPKPKCQLACEKTACDAERESKCCACNKEDNAKKAINNADSNSEGSESSSFVEMKPTFLEVMSEMTHRAQAGAETQCCPCASADNLSWEN